MGLTLTGTSGANVLTGGDGDDVIDGLQGDDILTGGKGNDRITTGPGFDIVDAGDGDDFIIVKRSTGPDQIDGGTGTDRAYLDYSGTSRNLTLDISDSSVLQNVGEGSTIIGVERMEITGGSGTDIFTGGALADKIGGGLGNDILRGNGGDDQINGGDGTDIAIFAGAMADYTITTLPDGMIEIVSVLEGRDLLTSIELLRFADGDMPLSGGGTTPPDPGTGGGDTGGGDSGDTVPTGPVPPASTYWTSTNGTASFVGGVKLPDGRGAPEGYGFTCTGLTREPDGTWWVANQGQQFEGDSTYTPSLVHLSADRRTKIGEIELNGGVRSVQGLVYMADSDMLMFASHSQRVVRIIKTDGTFVRDIGMQVEPTRIAPNALGYDPILKAAVIGRSEGSANNNVVEWRSIATGALIKTITIKEMPDHIWFDASQGPEGTLWYSQGQNGRTGWVYQIDVASQKEVGRYGMTAADAIEGIWVEDGKLWIANDAGFHPGNPPENRVLEFNITPNAHEIDRTGTTRGLTIDINQDSQTLADGTKIKGIDRLFFAGGEGNDTVTGAGADDILVGNGGGDVLDGRGGNDRIVGGGGNDTLIGGRGNDTIEGGDNSDTAVFSGNRSQYEVTKLSDTSVRVRDTRSNSDGTDTVKDVENFRFADGTWTFANLVSGGGSSGGGGTIDIGLSGLVIAELSASGTQIGTLSASGGAGGYSFSLVDSAGGRFAISSGRLVATSVALNFEAAASHDVRIKVTDSGGRTSEETFSIAVSDRNDAPTALNVSNQITLAQNTSIETKVADLAVVDEDTASQFRSYSFSVSDARFLVRDNALILKAGQSLDAAGEPSIAVRITLVDGAFTLERNLSVAVSTTGGGGGGTPTGTTGTEGDDRGATALVGTDNGETLNGLGGNDELYGKGGADTLRGGNGNDVLIGGAGADVLDGGTGQDAASYADASAGVKANLAKPSENTGDARGDSFVSIEDIFGSMHDDNLSGNNSANVLRGGQGNDRLSGQGGTDQLFGEQGNDLLFGQGGNDVLNGGAGDDILAGGSGGRDWFVFQGDWGADQITDFEDGVDLLDMRGNGLTFSDLSISQSGSHALVSAGAGFGTVLVQNMAVGSLTQSDFLFV